MAAVRSRKLSQPLPAASTSSHLPGWNASSGASPRATRRAVPARPGTLQLRQAPSRSPSARRGSRARARARRRSHDARRGSRLRGRRPRPAPGGGHARLLGSAMQPAGNVTLLFSDIQSSTRFCSNSAPTVTRSHSTSG
jgi:hypothetical protein